MVSVVVVYTVSLLIHFYDIFKVTHYENGLLRSWHEQHASGYDILRFTVRTNRA